MKIHPVPLLFACSLLVCEARAQSVTLTFTAQHNGAFVPIDSILITDLTQGEDTVLYYPIRCWYWAVLRVSTC